MPRTGIERTWLTHLFFRPKLFDFTHIRFIAKVSYYIMSVEYCIIASKLNTLEQHPPNMREIMAIHCATVAYASLRSMDRRTCSNVLLAVEGLVSSLSSLSLVSGVVDINCSSVDTPLRFRFIIPFVLTAYRGWGEKQKSRRKKLAITKPSLTNWLPSLSHYQTYQGYWIFLHHFKLAVVLAVLRSITDLFQFLFSYHLIYTIVKDKCILSRTFSSRRHEFIYWQQIPQGRGFSNIDLPFCNRCLEVTSFRWPDY